MEQQSIGKRIMQLRKEKGLTQEQLAERMGVTAQAVSKWENDVSCPDISILSKLAEVIGTTTDELLGAKPLESHVVVVGAKNKEKEDSELNFSLDFNGGKSVWFALMLIALGAAFLFDKLGVLPVGIWGIVWPAVLIGLGVSWFIPRFNFFGLGTALLGLYFLLYNLGAITVVLTWGIIWPSLIILLGLSIIFDRLIPRKKCRFHKRFSGRDSRSSYSEEGGVLHADCSFGEEERRFSGESFAGGDIDVSFAQGTYDLSNVRHIAPGARLNADVSFGSCVLIVPRRIRLDLKADKSFGSVQMRGEPDHDAVETLRLDGDVSFGELSIRYV